MKKVVMFGSVLMALALVAGFNSGCGGSDSSSTTVTTNGVLVVTNVPPAAVLDGSWNGSMASSGAFSGGAFSLHLTQSGDTITGTVNFLSYTENVTGSLSGDAVSLTWSHKGPAPLFLIDTITLTGNANSSRDNMAGNYAEVILGTTTPGTWSASK